MIRTILTRSVRLLPVVWRVSTVLNRYAVYTSRGKKYRSKDSRTQATFDVKCQQYGGNESPPRIP